MCSFEFGYALCFDQFWRPSRPRCRLSGRGCPRCWAWERIPEGSIDGTFQPLPYEPNATGLDELLAELWARPEFVGVQREDVALIRDAVHLVRMPNFVLDKQTLADFWLWQ